MGCPSILTCNVAVVTHRVALERFVIYVACLSCAEGQPVLSCHPRLVGFARQCPTLAVWALRLGGVVFQRLHQNSYPGRCSRCCVDGVVLGWCCPRILDRVVFQKLGWCSKKLSQNPRWGGVPHHKSHRELSSHSPREV